MNMALDPIGAVLAELDRPNAGQVPTAGLVTSGAINRVAFEFNADRQAKERLEARRKEAERKEAEKVAAAKRAADGATSESGDMEKPSMERPMEANAAPPVTPPETPQVQNFFREAKARYDAAINADIGFVERLVWFWSNHFCVNADGTVMAGAYEREAVRPHVLGH